MGEKTINMLTFGMNILLVLYFVILAAERTQSLVRAAAKKALWTDGLHNYMAGLCFVSFIGTIGILLAKLLCMIRFMQGNVTNSQDATHYATMQLILLAAAVGCILLSGMVHTEYSIPGIQFASYGVLILAMVLCVIMQQDILTPGKRALVLLFIVAFSMAIPVVYPSECKYKQAFYITEAVVSFLLVAVFAVMFFALFYGNYALILNPAFIVLALIGDILVLALRWQEQVNGFVLVSLAVATVAWIACAIVVRPGLR